MTQDTDGSIMMMMMDAVGGYDVYTADDGGCSASAAAVAGVVVAVPQVPRGCW